MTKKMSTIISFISWLSVVDVKLYTDEKKQLCSICLWIELLVLHCHILHLLYLFKWSQLRDYKRRHRTQLSSCFVSSLFPCQVRQLVSPLTFDIQWQAPDHRVDSGLHQCPHMTYLHWWPQVCAVKSFMKLCLLEQPQYYSSYKVCGLLSTSETVTTQNTPGQGGVRSEILQTEFLCHRIVWNFPMTQGWEDTVSKSWSEKEINVVMRHGTLLQSIYIDVARLWRGTRNQGRADTFYITSIQIPSLQRW